MKHRWLASLLFIAVALVACTPAEEGSGPDGSVPEPADFYDGY